MGSLRLKPRDSTALSATEYKHFSDILQQARSAAMGHHVYWDLGTDEDPTEVRKTFLYVAEQEGISVAIRKARGNHSLAFSFKNDKAITIRISASECRKRIVKALSSTDKPLQKAEIITHTGISSTTWNLRINELVSSGKVVRIGDRRDTRYRLVS